MSNPDIKLATTLYAFTNEFHSRDMSLADLIRETEIKALGRGIEIVGFQSFRTFPDISDQEAENFEALISATSLEKVCLGINADRYMDPGKPVSDDEMVAYHERQVKSAAKLGFPIVRYQINAGPDVIRRVLPLAEKLEVKLGLEIHAPHAPDHPEVIAYREMYREVDSECLGFIPDFGATCRDIHPEFLAYFTDVLGVTQQSVDKAVELWFQDMSGHERMEIFQKWAADEGASDSNAMELMLLFNMVNRRDPAIWSEIMDDVIHIHGKFYGVDSATGEDPAIDYKKAMKVFFDGGYQGHIVSEWEGHVFTGKPGFPYVIAHQRMLKSTLDNLSENR